MEYIDGCKIGDIKAIEAHGLSLYDVSALTYCLFRIKLLVDINELSGDMKPAVFSCTIIASAFKDGTIHVYNGQSLLFCRSTASLFNVSLIRSFTLASCMGTPTLATVCILTCNRPVIFVFKTLHHVKSKLHIASGTL